MSKKVVFIILIIGLGAIWAISEFNVIDMGRIP